MAYVFKEYRLIFFQVYRTGSSTIESLLHGTAEKLLGFQTRHLPVRVFLEHIKNKPYLTKCYNDYFKFAFVRNPFDLVCSLYEHTKHFQRDAVELKTFDSFVDWYLSEQHPTVLTADDIRRTQWELLADNENKINLQFVGRFENFEADTRKLFLELNIKLPKGLPRLNSFKDKNYKTYRDYYTNSETKNKIEHKFKKDLEYWNYDF